MNKTCPNCNVIKPSWSTHRLCPKCRRAKVPNVTIVERKQVFNEAGEPVVVKTSNQVIKITKAYTRLSRKSMAYVNMWTNRRTKALVRFNETIYLCGGWYHRWNPEITAQTLSCESIHLAMNRLGFGIENIQFDKMKLHTWDTNEESVEEYDGIAIKQYGLRAQD